MHESASSEPASYAIGRDHVTRTPERLVIHAAIDRTDWRVVPYRKPVFLHAGRRWDLVAVRPGHDGTIRFDFVPWPEQRTDPPGRTIVYDEESVVAEAQRRGEERSTAAIGYLFAPLAPLLGTLWSGSQRAATARVGWSPATLTRASIAAEYLVSVLAAVGLLLVGGAILAPLLVPFLVDAAVRWSRLAERDDQPLGAFEWLSAEQRHRRRGGRLGR